MGLYEDRKVIFGGFVDNVINNVYEDNVYDYEEFSSVQSEKEFEDLENLYKFD